MAAEDCISVESMELLEPRWMMSAAVRTRHAHQRGAAASVHVRTRHRVSAPPAPVAAARSVAIPALPALSAGANVDATRLSGAEAEAQVAINPTNTNNLVIVSQTDVSAGAAIPVTVSVDGGKNWFTTPLGGTQDRLFANNPRPDARVAFDSFGNLYVAYMAAYGLNQVGLVVARSSNGGASFDKITYPVNGASYDVDSPSLAIGPDATNPKRQAIWMSFTDYQSGRVMIVGGTSSGLGQFGGWSVPRAASHSFGTFSSITVGPRGEVAVAWQSTDSGVGPSDLLMNVDADGLGTEGFGADRFLLTSNVGGWDPIPAQPDRTIDANVNIAFDRSGGATNGRLYLAYTNASSVGSPDTDIFLKYSDNQGASWSGGVRVNDDRSGNSQFLPALAVDQSTGNVGLAWHDARNSPTNTGVQVFSTVSFDHGRSVQPNLRVSTGMSYQAGANPSSNDLDFGDIGGLAFAGGKLVPVWSDNSNPTGGNPNGTGSKFDIDLGVISVTTR